MKSKYTLRYLPIAVDDLISIFDWIANNSTINATAFIEKIDKRIGKLESYPNLGRVPRDEKLRNTGYRVLVVESYLIFYIIHEKIVEIHRVIHGSRNLEDLI